MALRHNISKNPDLLALARNKLAQLRNIMGKKNKHISQVVGTKSGMVKLRIAGEHEYAFLMGNKNADDWALVAYYKITTDDAGEVNKAQSWFNAKSSHAFIGRYESFELALAFKPPEPEADPSKPIELSDWSQYLKTNPGNDNFISDSVEYDNKMSIINKNGRIYLYMETFEFWKSKYDFAVDEFTRVEVWANLAHFRPIETDEINPCIYPHP